MAQLASVAPDAPRGLPMVITARTSPDRRYWGLVIATLFAPMFLISSLHAVLPSAVMSVISSMAAPAILVANVALVMFGANGRAVRLDLEPHRVLVDGGRGGVFPLAGAAVGLWRLPSIGTAENTLLQLDDGARKLRIVGWGHRPPPGVALSIPADSSYDLRVTGPEMQALLDLVEATGRAAIAPDRVSLRCELVRHPWAVAHMFTLMLPWAATIAAIFLLNGILTLALGDTVYARYAQIAVTLPLLLGGMVMTVIRSQRRTPKLELEIGDRDMTVRELATKRAQFTAPVAGIRGVRAMHVVHRKGVHFQYPCLRIVVPGHADLVLGVYDPRFAWDDVTPWLDRMPPHIVSAPDWEAIVGRLGLSAHVRVVGPPG